MTLELGGKSPCIINNDVTDIDLAVKRISWGKFANAGQTCIAPDYVLCHEDKYDEFVAAFLKRIEISFGNDPSLSTSYCRMVTEMHCDRVANLIKQAVSKGGVATSDVETVDTKARFIPPTLLLDILPDNWNQFDIMNEEIFGPALPIIKVPRESFTSNKISAMVKNIHAKPLALYIFAKDRTFIDNVLTKTPSGGVCVNEVVFHYGNCNLPFGGIGSSGLGAGHGIHGFKAFSHHKAILRKDDHMMLDIPQRYPPYDGFKLMVFRINAVLPSVPYISKTSGRLFAFAVVGLMVTKMGQMCGVVSPTLISTLISDLKSYFF